MKRWFFKARFPLAFLLVTALPLAGLAWFYLDSFGRSLQDTVLRNLSSIADKKSDEIDDFIGERLKDAAVNVKRERVQDAIRTLSPLFRKGGLPAIKKMEGAFTRDFLPLVDSGQYYDVLLVDAEGNVVFSIMHEADWGSNLMTGTQKDSGLAEGFRKAARTLDADFTAFKPYAPSNNKVATFAVSPVLGDDGHLIGALALQLNLDSLTQVVSDKTGLGLSGETVLAQRRGEDVLYAAPLNHVPDAAYRYHTSLAQTAIPMQKALSGEHGSGMAEDYAGVKVIAVWRYLPSLHWAMVVKMDAKEAFSPLYAMQKLVFAVLLAFLFLSGILAFLVYRRIFQADEDIRENRERLAGIIDSAMDAVITADEEQKIIIFNRAAEHIFGYESSDVIGKPLEMLIPLRLRKKHRKHVEAYGQNGVSARTMGMLGTVYGLRASGEEFPIEASISHDKTKGNIHYTVILRDITLRRESEKKIRLLTQMYSALSEANHVLIECRNEADLFDHICRIAVEAGGMKMAWIGRMSDEGLIRPVASYGEGTSYLDGLVIDAHADTPTAISFREGRGIVIQDFAGDPLLVNYREGAKPYGWGASATFPIFRGGKAYASLAFYHGEKNPFDDEIIELMEEMLVNVGYGLDRFDLEEKKRQAEESVRLAAVIYQSSAEAVMVTDENNLIVDVNPAFTRQTGYSLEEVRGKNPRLLQSGRHDKAFYQEMWKTIMEQGYWQGEIWDSRKDGSLHVKLANICVIRHPDGSVYRHVAQFFDITDRKQKEDLIWKQANFDSLTSLPNRRLFQDRLDQEIKKAYRSRLPLALLFIDLDRFKEINDTLGHAKGDNLLIEAAQRIKKCVRETDTVARLGGDEFTVVLPDFGEKSDLERIAHDIIRILVTPFDLGDGDTGYISASIGITLYPEDASNVEALLKHADQAMYLAKAEGRNRFGYFTASMQREAQEKLSLTNELRQALSRNELQVYYQPILEMRSGRIVKVEALLRWLHHERGMVSPVVFIPLAEESGLIHEIGEWVFHQSIGSIERWREKFGRIIQVSVNKSPAQFEQLAKPSWSEKLLQAGLPGNAISVEITEGLLLSKSDKVKQSLMEYRNKGIEVSIDDFGTGFSALSYLKQFDIDYLKIDRSFVKDMTVNDDDKALTEAIIVMAHKLGIKTIAEGVEIEAQRDMLLEFDCDYVQGYLFSKPVPFEEIEILLQREDAGKGD